MNNYFKIVLFAFLVLVGFPKANAQADCVLGVGITEDATLIDIFQMNQMQQEKLADFAAELKYRNELLNNRLENIAKKHPQSTQTELMRLADEYKKTMDSMASIQKLIDKKILALFNEKQYELYRSLCKEAMRSPFIVVPAVYTDSIPVKD